MIKECVDFIWNVNKDIHTEKKVRETIFELKWAYDVCDLMKGRKMKLIFSPFYSLIIYGFGPYI